MSQINTDEWGRLTRQPAAGNRAGIYMQGGELRKHGIDPATLGLLDLKAAQKTGAKVEIPVVQNMALSLPSSTEVQLIQAKANVFRRNHPIVAEGVFGEDHPEAWLAALAEFDQALLVITAKRLGETKTLGEFMDHWHIGIIPVAYRLDFDGFSMHPATVKVDLP